MTQGFNEQSDSLNLELPETLQQYEVKAIVAQDHSTQVFAAWDTQLCRNVWIRRIHLHSENTEQILKEARLAAALKHAAFVRIHGLEENGENLFIFSEAVAGVPLLDWVAQNNGNQKMIFDVTMQIASALAEAHQAGLVHGDIQAKQFLIDANRQVRILNCGFVSSRSSYMLSSIEQIDSSGGLAYLAPERFANAAATPASDVYALGTLLYQMLQGSLPFAHLQGLAMVAALVQPVAEQWPCRAEISPALRNWMRGMLKRVPEQRLSCVQIVEQGVAIREAEGYSSSNSKLDLLSLKEQQVHVVRRQKYAKLAMLTLVVVLVVGGGWQAKPFWPKIVKALTPYSEQREFESAMQAILMSDQPGMLDKAEEHLTRMLEHDVANAKAVAGLSICYSNRLNSDGRDEVWRERALASAQQAMKLNPNLAITQIAFARALDPHQQFDLAIQAVRRAKELDANNLLAWRTEIHILLIAQKYEDLSRILDSAAKKFPSDWFVSLYRGVQYINEKKYEDAEQVLRQGISQRPDTVSIYAYLSMAMNSQGRAAEALQVLQQGLQIRPNATLFNQVAEIKFSQGELDAAIAAWQKAVSPTVGNPRDYYAWRRLGDALNLVPGKQAESIKAYSEAQKLLEPRLERRPNSYPLIYHMVHISYQVGEMKKARQLVDHALGLFPKDKSFFAYSALIHYRSAELSDAVKDVKRAESLGEIPEEIRKMPAFIELKREPRYHKSN